MNRYDEDRVIALLRDAVPPPPDGPDRVTAVKHRAGRQRAALWTQTLGAVASVLLVVGVAAAVSGPDGPRRIDPTKEPLQALSEALTRERAVRFEATMELAGEPKQTAYTGLSPEQLAEAMSARLTGAVTRDGDVEVSGDASFLRSWAFGHGSDESAALGEMSFDVQFRMVDGTSYRSAMGERLPQGKRWISDTNGERYDVDDLRRALNVLSLSAEGVKYVREVEIGDEPVAEYEFVVPRKLTESIPLKVRFALDAQDRLRRVTSQFSWTELTMGSMVGYEEQAVPPGVMASPGSGGWTEYGSGDDGPQRRPQIDPLVVRIQVDFFGYGENVVVKAPPAHQVISEHELYESQNPDMVFMTECLEKAGPDRQKARQCYTDSRIAPDGPLTVPECEVRPDGSEECAFSSSSSATLSPYGGYGSSSLVATAAPVAPGAARPTVTPAGGSPSP